MTFDPTTNRIPFGLLTSEERVTLGVWPHGWEYYQEVTKTWTDCVPEWSADLIYRGKPAPKVTSYWFNVYKGHSIGNIWTSQAAASYHANSEGSTVRMDICNGEVTVTKET